MISSLVLQTHIRMYLYSGACCEWRAEKGIAHLNGNQHSRKKNENLNDMTNYFCREIFHETSSETKYFSEKNLWRQIIKG